MCMTDLYIKMLNHNIAHVTYDAEIAGLRFACFHFCASYVCVVITYADHAESYSTPSDDMTQCRKFDGYGWLKWINIR